MQLQALKQPPRKACCIERGAAYAQVEVEARIVTPLIKVSNTSKPMYVLFLLVFFCQVNVFDWRHNVSEVFSFTVFRWQLERKNSALCDGPHWLANLNPVTEWLQCCFLWGWYHFIQREEGIRLCPPAGNLNKGIEPISETLWFKSI
jgi:hypothetical protein